MNINKLDILFFIKNKYIASLAYLLIIPTINSLLVTGLYFLISPFFHEKPEWLAFKLTMVIMLIMGISLFIGLLITKQRFTRKSNLNIGYNLKVLIALLFSLFSSFISQKICYSLYVYFVTSPPLENLGFGMLLFINTIIVFLLTLCASLIFIDHKD